MHFYVTHVLSRENDKRRKKYECDIIIKIMRNSPPKVEKMIEKEKQECDTNNMHFYVNSPAK